MMNSQKTQVFHFYHGQDVSLGSIMSQHENHTMLRIYHTFCIPHGAESVQKNRRRTESSEVPLSAAAGHLQKHSVELPVSRCALRSHSLRYATYGRSSQNRNLFRAQKAE